MKLEDLTWLEAEKALVPEAIVVIPLGASSKEHGPHLRLDNDRVLAEYFARRISEEEDVVMAPLVAHHYYPAFVDYPGSISLRIETARDLIVDIVKSLAAFGPRRFYVLNTGVSTVKALALSAEALAADGIILRYTDLRSMEEAREKIALQESGTHADEIETAMMLHIAPDRVDMTKAVKDIDGVFGDATLATEEKGAR